LTPPWLGPNQFAKPVPVPRKVDIVEDCQELAHRLYQKGFYKESETVLRAVGTITTLREALHKP
jgi:hypothetical protein